MNLQTLLAATLQNCPDPKTCATNFPNVGTGSNNPISNILKLVFAIIGVVALIYILLAGLKFITSAGNPEQVAKARQSIIFGAIGLVVAASAEIIVIFILEKV